MIRPSQKLSFSQKDDAWKENNLRWCSETATIGLFDNNQLKDLYDLAAGRIKETSYKYVTNPFNSKDRKYTKYPTELKNFDIMSSIFSQLIGESIKRPLEPIVYSKNDDVYNQQNDLEYKRFIESLQQTFVNTLIQNGLFVEGQTDEQGQPINAPLSPDVIKKEKKNLKKLKIIEDQNILDYIIDAEKIETKLRNCFYDFIVTRACFTYKDVVGDEIVYKRIPREKLYYSNLDNIDFIEDAEIVKCVNEYSLNELIDLFRDEEDFTNDLINDLERLCSEGDVGFFATFKRNFNAANQLKDSDGSAGKIDITKLTLEHIQWTSLKKIYRIYKVNALGQTIKIDVDEDYIFEEGEEKEMKWVNEKWQGYIIAGRFYIGCRPLPLQRGTFDNPNSCKNSYNGKIFKKGFNVLTITEKLEPYQKMYNILKYKIQFVINKNKDKITIVPIGLLGHLKKTMTTKETTNDGQEVTVQEIDEESALMKSLYYADATGFLFVDESIDGAATAATMLKTVDAGLGNYIKFLYEYANNVKTEAEELIGFNRFRKADINTSDAVSNVNAGSYAGSLITEEYFVEFNEFVECEMQGLMDLSKFAFINGKKASFLRSDGELAHLKLEEGAIQEKEFGVFSKNGGKTKEDLDILKARTLEFAQNGMQHGMIGKIINSSNNFAKLIDDIEEMDEKLNQQQQAQQQQESQLKEMEIQQKAKAVEDQLKLDYYKIDQDNETKIEIAYAQLTDAALARNENGDLIAIEKLREDTIKRIQEGQIKSAELGLKNKEIESKERIAEKQLQIARVNKN